MLRSLRSSLAALAFTAVLAGCAQPAAQAPAATIAPAPTSAATQAPAQPAAAGVLPAPLLLVDQQGQLALLDVDGATVTALTSEDDLIMNFAVGPETGTVAYITVVEGGRSTTLVRVGLDGSGRTELARGTLGGVTVAADGSVQAGVLFDAARADGAPLASGTWSFPADGGAPTLLVAGTAPATDAGGNVTPGTHYTPEAWSPGGDVLLLRTSATMGPDGPDGDIGSLGLALYDAGAAQARDLLLPGAPEAICVDAAWSYDGAAIICANAAAIGAPTPALWRLWLADGARETLLPVVEAEPLTATFAPRDLPEGLSVLVGTYDGDGQTLMPRRFPHEGPAIQGPGIDQLASRLQTDLGGGIIAPDGSGVIYGRAAGEGSRALFWQPFGEGVAAELPTVSIGPLVWVSR